MTEFTVVLRRRMFECEATIRGIANRINALCARNKFILIESAHILAESTKFIKAKNKLILDTVCDTVVTKTIKDLPVSKLILKSDAGATLTKFCSAANDKLILASNKANACLTRLRKIGEMDTDGANLLTLGDFDNMTLEDIDYIVIS